MTKRRWLRALAGMTSVAVLAACGGAEDEQAAGGGNDGAAAPGADVQAYCEAARTLDEQESFPTSEQLDGLVTLAPGEIKDDVEFVVGRFKEGIAAGDPAGAFADPEVEQRLERVEEFEVRECGLEGEDEQEQDPSVTELDPAAARVDVRATEYDFEVGPTRAGRTSFVMANDGEESHVMVVARLAEGATLEQALLAEDPDQFVEQDFESDIAGPGEEAVVTAELTPGNWAMVCPLPASDGQPHLLKGMAVPFTVE